jgi:hypothetical protein
VLVTKEDAAAEVQAASGLPAAPPTSLTVGTKPDELPRNRRFYQIAHSVMEAVATQPTMLKNGTLKEYQLKGRGACAPASGHTPSGADHCGTQGYNGWCHCTTTT